MIKIVYAPIFVKKLNKLHKNIQDEVLDKVELFKNKDNHSVLKVHKLHGKFRNSFSFYINYKIRIIFEWGNDSEVNFLSIGDHDLYK